jgi:hypothetical protein
MATPKRAPSPATRSSRPAAPSVPEKLGGIGSDAVQKATGRTWPEWIAFLDGLDAIKLPHKEIAALLHEKHNIPGWWCQMVTVGYEQAKGRRIVGQTCAGDFSANGAKTLPISADAAHAWFADDRKRARWLDGKTVLRTANAPKSARLGFPDGTIAGVFIMAKGDVKCSVGISHDKLSSLKIAEGYKAFWKTALARLAEIAA